MTALPIVPGHTYHVHGAGLSLTVIAQNPVDAICVALDIILESLQ
ncbi:hypothetical protein [Cupriavidus malaysiensis]|nr:hypothetical protein [Cupriavidus malaysiensis]